VDHLVKPVSREALLSTLASAGVSSGAAGTAIGGSGR
jgi:hypothetical protein